MKHAVAHEASKLTEGLMLISSINGDYYARHNYSGIFDDLIVEVCKREYHDHKIVISRTINLNSDDAHKEIAEVMKELEPIITEVSGNG